jgi:hypothetical protein
MGTSDARTESPGRTSETTCDEFDTVVDAVVGAVVDAMAVDTIVTMMRLMMMTMIDVNVSVAAKSIV